MATQVRNKPANKVPVTKHPLFPAMVALWFGALFGLGSLAVRTSLLESLVLSLSLDVLLPAVAPPLGMKTRLILALLMAAIGVAVGAYLARRIARPKLAESPRRRGVGSSLASRQGHTETSVQADPGAARRRSLTIETEEHRDDHYDAAPLPGGSPAIFDVTQIELSRPEDEALVLPEAEPLGSQVDAPLALDAFVVEERAQAEPAPDHSIGQIDEAAFEQPFVDSPPVPQADRQVFRTSEPEQAITEPPSVEDPQPVALNFNPPVDAAPQPSEAPLELLAEQVFTVIAELPVQAEVDEYARMVEGLRKFECPEAVKGSTVTPAEWTGEPPAEWTGEPPISESRAALETAPQAAATESPLDQAQCSDQPLPVVPPALLADPLPQAGLGSRIETSDLSELSPVELVERLAQAMRQRTHQGPIPGSLVDAVSSLVAAAPVDLPLASIASESEPEQAEVPPVQQLDERSEQSEPAPKERDQALSAPMPLALPAALTPINFDDYADDDESEDMPLPPRSFAPQSVEAPAAAELMPSEPEVVPGGAAALADETEGEVPEDSYSSLLELGRPALVRQDFVRIDEPEEESAAFEPVVIFPGHGARPGQRFAAPDPAVQSDQANQAAMAGDAAEQAIANADPGVPQLRRFDAPAATAQSVHGHPATGIRQDPEEAQRALRSALATLQRMSGAA